MKGLTKLKKLSAGFAAIGAVIAVTLGAAAPALAVETYYSNEDGANRYVESCAGADFTVTIDGTEYGPGDVATGFSLDSDYSVSAGTGVTVNFVAASLVQGAYGHGLARDPLAEGGLSNFDVSATGDWLTLNSIETFFSAYPGTFFAECPGDDRFAYIQTFPGLTLDQAGHAASLDQGVYLSDQAQFDSLALDPNLILDAGLVFAPMSNFRNAAYAVWANFLEADMNGNPSASVSFADPLGLSGDAVEGVWGYSWWGSPQTQTTVEFASSYYTYASGSGLTESGVNDGLEEDGAPSALAATGANVEWLMFAGLLAVVSGSGFLLARRRTRI